MKTGGGNVMDKLAYQNGMDTLKTGDYKAAERAFKAALDSMQELDDMKHSGEYNKIQSYYGLVQVLNGNDHGLWLCRDAASRENHEGDVFLNLACAELEVDNRKRAIEAVQHGIKIDADNDRLKRACGMLECRNKCCFGFLSRQHLLNRFFGRLKRRAGPPLKARTLLYN
jgi:tetratricopeptide (TPR) repeat protein